MFDSKSHDILFLPELKYIKTRHARQHILVQFENIYILVFLLKQRKNLLIAKSNN